MAPVTRWLVVGPYPPERGTGADAAHAFVEQRLRAGDHVHVLSPRPTAAHEHAALEGVHGLRALWDVARSQGAEGIWLRVEPGIVLRHGVSRWRGLAERAALVLLLRRFRERIFDVGDVGLLPGGRAGRPVLAVATRFDTHRAADADALVLHGADPARLHRGTDADVRRSPGRAVPAEAQVASVAYPPPDVVRDLPADRASLQAGIRARAEQLRAARRADTAG